MSVTIDANVLVYATNESDPAFPVARALLGRLAAGPELVYLFWPVSMAYLRIVTHPAILPRPLAAEAAIANLGDLLHRPHVRSPGERDGFWTRYQAVAGHDTAGPLVPDAHVAALMHQHGVRRIYTRDRDFRRFAGIEPVDPFAA